ncbi:hypothetical protein BU14_1593s0002 [Porphyra umbilicalis]|uniref:Uncharacterized protein n=1 Tax=Porphyra umbilicalis TaxID=2786 RepID=A0A1X6NL86_PORUM|nr:hypothetical protein BU14_1593s0002 [Porphyra umbilicalis]|eukprot:OSX69358.1 hypothetical protein BU14_1593s0002 [Porphyra umbilicalis]
MPSLLPHPCSRATAVPPPQKKSCTLSHPSAPPARLRVPIFLDEVLGEGHLQHPPVLDRTHVRPPAEAVPHAEALGRRRPPRGRVPHAHQLRLGRGRHLDDAGLDERLDGRPHLNQLPLLLGRLANNRRAASGLRLHRAPRPIHRPLDEEPPPLRRRLPPLRRRNRFGEELRHARRFRALRRRRRPAVFPRGGRRRGGECRPQRCNNPHLNDRRNGGGGDRRRRGGGHVRHPPTREQQGHRQRVAAARNNDAQRQPV